MKFISFLFFSLFCFPLTAQSTLYVNPDAPDNPSADGSLASPYNDISATVDLLVSTGGEVIVIDGEYDMSNKKVRITTIATATKTIKIKPQTTAGVKFNFNDRFGFEFDETSRYITLEGFELNGRTDELDYWCIVAQAFWGDETIPRNGGSAVILDGQHITIKDNYIHDWYQKAVEIRDGRYVVVEGNIIQNIATTSLSGGHGIMRQQKGQEYFDDDDVGVYRWDIKENMVFSVEQRIYSWVPKKGFIHMVIDEGKSILIDDAKDTDGDQEEMSARIINNIVAFGSVDHIRLKSTRNLEVSNNSIYAEGANADGITDKIGDTLFLQTMTGVDTIVPQFTNFICKNNAVQTAEDIFAIEIDNAIDQTNDNSGTAVVSGNYTMDGKIKPSSQSGLTKLTNGQLFTDPTNGNFTINPSLMLPSTTGVSPSVLTALNQKATNFGVTFSSGTFVMDHLKLTQTILDNIPGLNDGVSNNENVFEDYGTMSNDHKTILFDVVNGDWKTNTESGNQQNFKLNEDYYNWYADVATSHLNSQNEEYERIRWGDSEVKQNQVFDPDWLTVSQIKSSSNTLINGHDNDFTLDGDILIDFKNFTPQVGDMFDLISANTITTNNTGSNLFDNVIFEGFTPNNYSLEVVNVSGKQVVRLTIITVLPIELLSFEARKKDQFSYLEWKTISEEGNEYFSIERIDSYGQWKEIGRVAGQGNSTELIEYNFIDQSPLFGKNYYRLRQQDYDGKFTYSQVRVVSFSKNMLEVKPNPAENWFVVDTDFPIGKIHLFNGIGQEVSNQCIIIPVQNGYQFITESLTPGIYYLKVENESVQIIIN